MKGKLLTAAAALAVLVTVGVPSGLRAWSDGAATRDLLATTQTAATAGPGWADAAQSRLAPGFPTTPQIAATLTELTAAAHAAGLTLTAHTASEVPASTTGLVEVRWTITATGPASATDVASRATALATALAASPRRAVITDMAITSSRLTVNLSTFHRTT